MLNDCRSDMGFSKKKHAIKCPTVIQHVIEEARKKGKTSATLEEIVDRIVTLGSG
jgi:2-keto-3-deoxy-L-rhamnonate aldolase RhmA